MNNSPLAQVEKAQAAIDKIAHFPIAREADGTVTPYLTNAQLYAILEDEDLEQCRRLRNQHGALSQ